MLGGVEHSQSVSFLVCRNDRQGPDSLSLHSPQRHSLQDYHITDRIPFSHEENGFIQEIEKDLIDLKLFGITLLSVFRHEELIDSGSLKMTSDLIRNAGCFRLSGIYLIFACSRDRFS